MHHRSLRCSSFVLLVLAAGCGGGDFIGGSVGKVRKDAGPDASTGAVSGKGGSQSGGAGGSSSSSGGLSSSGGDSTTSGGTSATGGHQGSGIPDASTGGAETGSDAATDAGGGTAGTSAGGGNGTAGAGGDIATGGTGNGSGGAESCTSPTTWYIDEDQDGYGSSSTPPVVSCVPPPGHFTKVGGDCNDSNDMVHPQLTAPEIQYLPKPYQTSSGIDSFDYDCSGHEDGDPGQAKAASTCPALTLGTCGGSGFRQVSTGNRVAANGYCGSKTYRTCVNTAGVTCSAQDNTSFSEAYRCK